MESMDSKREKTPEPYSPTNTPNPPQDIDPSRHPEKNNDNNSFGKQKKKDSKTSKPESVKKKKSQSSEEPETEIDETDR